MRLPNQFERDLDLAARESRAFAYIEATRPKDSKLSACLATLLIVQTFVVWCLRTIA